MNLPALKTMQFTAHEREERRVAMLNDIVAMVAALRTALVAIEPVLTFTAGAGMVNSGTDDGPVADVVAADATIVVNPDSIRVGTITGANITDGSISSDDVDDTIATTDDVAKLRRELQHIRLLLIELVSLEMEMAA